MAYTGADSDSQNGNPDEKRFGILPLAQLVLEVAALVDEDLPVVGEHDARALERARRRFFEVDAGQTKAAAVARTLELVFSREEFRRAAEGVQTAMSA